jgi:hypothetical protein
VWFSINYHFCGKIEQQTTPITTNHTHKLILCIDRRLSFILSMLTASMISFRLPTKYACEKQRTSLILPQRPHPLNCFFASTGYGAYQKALAGAFQ